MSKARTDQPLHPLNCAILTLSDKRQPGDDESGDYLASRLSEAGHRVAARDFCSGNLYEIRRIVSNWIADSAVQVIITSGGTGFTKKVSTATAIQPLLDTVITGFGELFRHLSYQEMGSSALQSDAFAGLANNTLLFCLPGSPDACRLAWEQLLSEQLDSRHPPCNFASHYTRP